MSIDDKTQETLEVLHGINITDDSVELFVTSNGYTKKEDFRVDVNFGFTGHSPVAMTIFRTSPDVGKMMPHVIKVAFTKDELKIKGQFEVDLGNKIGNSPSGRQ